MQLKTRMDELEKNRIEIRMAVKVHESLTKAIFSELDKKMYRGKDTWIRISKRSYYNLKRKYGIMTGKGHTDVYKTKL